MIAAGLLAAGCASASKLSAADIVAKNVAARGGLEAWRKVQTMVWIGRIESAHAPMPYMPFQLAQKRPNRTRLQITTLGENSLRVFDGVHGWKLRAAHGRPEVQPYTPQEIKFAQIGHGIDGPLIDYAAKGNSVTLVGMDQVGERKAYHLSAHLAKGGDEDVWVDAETFLDLRCDRMAEGAGGATRRVSATYSDYRTVQGLQIPSVIQTGGGSDALPDRMLIDKVLLNAPLADSTFDNPAAPHLRKRTLPSVASQGQAAVAPSGEPGQPAEEWMPQ